MILHVPQLPYWKVHDANQVCPDEVDNVYHNE